MTNKHSTSNQNKAHFPATKRLVEDTFRTLGRLDYVFNSAGIGIVGETRLYELGDWNRVVDVNLRGVVHGVQAASDHAPARLRSPCRHGLPGRVVSLSTRSGLLRDEARGRRPVHVSTDRGRRSRS